MSRRFWVGGNWKLNKGTGAAAKELAQAVTAEVGGSSPAEVVIAPPTTVLHRVAEVLLGQQAVGSFAASAQNCHSASSGAFTGEISPEDVLDTGAQWVIIGHSERRTIFGETDAIVKEKVTAALRAGLKVCACIGETLEERESGSTKDVVFRQTQSLIEGVAEAGADAWARIVIAYEPVWAIGTGKVASPEQAQEVHAWLRGFVADKVSTDVASGLRIAYGGSVKPGNCKELAALEDIDGFLVGGASLIAADFAVIVASGSTKSHL